MMIKIQNYKCKSLNDYFEKHWAVKGKITKEEQELAYYECRNKIRECHKINIKQDPSLSRFDNNFKPIEKCKIIFTAYFKDKRRHDPDNLLCKNFIDGIVKAGIIKDDNSEVVKSLEKIIRAGSDFNQIIIEVIPQ